MAEPKTTIAEGVKLAYEATDDIADIKEDYLSKSEGGTINSSVNIQNGVLNVSSQSGTTTYGSTSIRFSSSGGSYVFDFPFKSGTIGMWGDDANSIMLEMDEDYKLQVSLRKNDGTVLQSQVIDLPLESMIVGIEYDPDTKCLIITLQNGETTSIPVDDIIGDNVVFVDNVQWVRDNQTTVSIAVDPTHNINGKSLTNFSSSEQTVGGYPAIVIQTADSNKLTKEQAARYMKAQTGSSYVPEYDYDNPSNPYIMFSNKTLWKPQWRDDLGLVLFSMGTTIVDAESDQTITGTKTFASNVVLANASSGESPEIRLQNNVNTTRIRANGYSTDINTHWLPRNGNTYTLGDTQLKWKELYLSGAASVGSLSLVGNTTWGLIPNQYGGLNVTKAGTSMYSFSDLAFFPQSNGSRNLGASNLKWNNLFISGSLNDGTNSVTVANIATKQEVENVREVAEGKCASYVLSYNDTVAGVKAIVEGMSLTSDFVCDYQGNDITSDLADYLSVNVVNADFNSQSDSVMFGDVDNPYLILRNTVDTLNPSPGRFEYVIAKLSDLSLKVGDIFLVLETNVPDRWYSDHGSGVHAFYKMETTKVDLTNYVTTNTAQTITGVKTFSNGISLNTISSTSDIILDTPNNYNVCSSKNGTVNLGNSFFKWKDLYLSGNINFNGIATIETLSDRVKAKYNGVDGWEWGTNSYRVFTPLATAAIYPTSDGQKDIGLSSQRYKDIYMSGSIVFDTNTKIERNASNNQLLFYAGNSNPAMQITDSRIYFRKSIRPYYSNVDIGGTGELWHNLYLNGNITDGTNNVAVANIAKKDQFVKLTQAQYDALTPDEDTFYFIEEE